VRERDNLICRATLSSRWYASAEKGACESVLFHKSTLIVWENIIIHV